MVCFFFFNALISSIGDSSQWPMSAFYQPFIFLSSMILLVIYQLPRTDTFIPDQLCAQMAEMKI